ncbi:MAG: hypothetical protein K2G07_04535 [Muribaculaceae bacterium]|nr:hypothetical protein [Muribaculaceae bacterium]
MFKILKFGFFLLCATLIVPSLSAHNSAVERFAVIVDSLHKHIVLPLNIAPGIVLTNIGVDKDENSLVINYMLNPELVDAVVANASSENGVAQLLTGYDEIFAQSMIEADACAKIVITSPSSDGKNNIHTVTIPVSDIKMVYHKLKKGDASPLMPYLEALKSTFSNMQFPVKIVEGINMINVNVIENEVCYTYKFEVNVDASKITDNLLLSSRQMTLANLRANLIPEYIAEIKEKGIKIRYNYLNNNGEALYEFVFSAEDFE